MSHPTITTCQPTGIASNVKTARMLLLVLLLCLMHGNIIASPVIPVATKTIAAGANHSLFLKNNGTVWASGVNSKGQLGDGSNTSRNSPVQVVGLTNIIAVAGGDQHSLFLKSDGTVFACGYNFSGQLGDPSTTDHNTPIQVSGLSGIIAIAAGADYSLFLKSDGTVFACGENATGQYGATWYFAATQISGLTNVIAISAGFNHSLFLKDNGTVYGTGSNTFGELADGTYTNRNTITQIAGLSDIIAISAGRGGYSLFLKNDGTVMACGENGSMQLGNSATTGPNSNVLVTSDITGVAGIAASTYHSLFLKTDSTVWGCGDNNNYQVGNTSATSYPSPAQVTGLTGITGIAAGVYHSVFVSGTCNVKACGTNISGQLGDGTNTDRSTAVSATSICPTIIPAPVNTKISISSAHTLFIKEDGSVWASGMNFMGQLGDGTTTLRSTPVPISITDVTAVSAGSLYSLFLKSDGTVWGCGFNGSGQLGDGIPSGQSTPMQVSGLTNIIAIVASENYSLFLKGDGTVWGLGRNDDGQLGVGTTTFNYSTPTQSPSLTGIVSIAGGGAHALFLKNDGTAWASGANYVGQLGNGYTTSQSTPVQVISSGAIIGISAGSGHSLFLKYDSTVLACGYNNSGQLGDGTTTNNATPTQISGLTGITMVSAGSEHSLFLKTDGTITGCGNNGTYQLGDGTFTNRYVPVPISGLTGITRILAGGNSSIFLPVTTCEVYGCGNSQNGQLGNGTVGNINTATQIFLTCVEKTWYSKSTGNLDDLATWGSNADGTGSNPDDFTSPLQTFNIRNNATPTISAGWSPKGIVNLGDGTNPIHFTIPVGAAYTGSVINVAANANLTITNAVVPALGTIGANTTVVYNGASQAVADATYWYLTMSGSGTATIPGNVTVQKDLTVLSGTVQSSGTLQIAGNLVITSGAVQNSGNLQITGDLLNNTGGTFNSNGGTVTFNGSTAQSINGDASFNNLTINNAAGLSGTGSSSILVDGAMLFSAGKYAINSGLLTFGTSASVSGMTPNTETGRNITGGMSAKVTCNNTGTLGTFIMDETNATTQTLLEFTAAGVTMGSPLTVGDGTTATKFVLASGTFNHDNYIVTCNGSVSGNPGTNFTGTYGGILLQVPGSNLSGSTSYRNVTIDVGAGNVINVSGSPTINGGLTFTSGKLSIGSNTLILGQAFYVTGMTPNSGTGCNITGGTSSVLVCSNEYYPLTLIMDETSIATQTLKQLTISGGNTTTLATLVVLGDGTISTALELNSGTLEDNGFPITCKGNITGSGWETGTGGITMVTPGTGIAGTIEKLTLNPGAGNVINITPGHTAVILGTLTFTTGKLNLGGNTLNISANASISGMTRNTPNGTGLNITGSTGSTIICNNTNPLTIIMDETDAASQSLIVLKALGGGDITLGTFVKVTQLTLTSGKVILGNFDLMLSSGPIFGGSAASHVVFTGSGKLKRPFTVNGLYTYATGDGTNYTPIRISVTGTGYSSANVAVTMTASKPTENTNVTDHLKRFWTVTTSGITTPSVSVVTATYKTDDVAGTESNIKAATYTGSGPWVKFNTVNTTAHTFSVVASPVTDGVPVIFTGITDVETSVIDFTSSSATSPCLGNSSVVTVNTSGMLSGTTYTVSYTLSGAGGNSGTYTSASFEYGSGTGSFIVDAANLSHAGATMVTINSITTGSSTIGAGTNNMANFTVNTAPVITAADNNGPLCSGLDLSLNSTASGGTGTLLYSWAGPALFADDHEDPTISFASASASGIYTVIVTDENTCSDTAITVATVRAAPVLGDITGNGSICAGNTLTLGCAAGEGAAPFNYHWYGPDFISEDGNSLEIPSVTTSASGTYTVVVSDDNNCTDTATGTVTVNPGPAITAINSNAPVCEGKLLSLSSTVTGGMPSYNYVWTGPNDFSSTEENPTITNNAVVAYDGTYRLVVTDDNSCADTATTSVTVYPIQPVTGPTAVAFGQTITLSDVVTGGTWSTPTPWTTKVTANNGDVKGVSTGTSQISYTTTHGCVATYTVSVYSLVNACVGQTITLSDGVAGGTWTTGNASYATVVAATGVVTGVGAGKVVMTHRVAPGGVYTTTVTVNPLAGTVAVPSSVCQGQSISLTNGTVGGGTWYSGNTSTAIVSSNGVVTGLAGGNVTIYFTPVAGCVTTKTVTINGVTPITGTPVVCVSQTTALNNATSGGAWSTSSGSYATVSPTGVVSGVSANTSIITYKWPNGCYATTVVTVKALSPITGSFTSVCMGQTIALFNATPGSGTWTSNPGVSVNGSGVVTGLIAGVANVFFNANDGCIATKAITVNAGPVLGGTPGVCVGQTTLLNSSMTGGTWSTSSGSYATVYNGIVGGVTAGTPTISYKMPGGCYGAVAVTVKALSQISGGSTGMCQSGSMTLLNTTPGGGAWSSSNTNAATVNPATGVVRGAGVGTTVISFTTTSGGCVATRNLLINACREGSSSETPSIDETVAAAFDVQLFPNPNSGSFMLKGTMNIADDRAVSMEVVNMLGQVVYHSKADVQKDKIETRIQLPEHLARGTYMLRLHSENGEKVFHFVVGK